ncbi:unnamed protein product [Sphagnum tenellum]
MACEAEKTLVGGGYDMYGAHGMQFRHGKMHGKVVVAERFKEGSWSRFNLGGLSDSSRIARFSTDDAIKLGSHFACNFLPEKTSDRRNRQETASGTQKNGEPQRRLDVCARQLEAAPARHSASPSPMTPNMRNDARTSPSSSIPTPHSAAIASGEPIVRDGSNLVPAAAHVALSPAVSTAGSCRSTPPRNMISDGSSRENQNRPGSTAAASESGRSSSCSSDSCTSAGFTRNPNPDPSIAESSGSSYTSSTRGTMMISPTATATPPPHHLRNCRSANVGNVTGAGEGGGVGILSNGGIATGGYGSLSVVAAATTATSSKETAKGDTTGRATATTTTSRGSGGKGGGGGAGAVAAEWKRGSSLGNIVAVGESLLIKKTLTSNCLDPEEVKRIGNEQYKKGNFAEALALYDRAILLAPGRAPFHCNRAAALTALGRLADAVRECELAVHCSSTNSPYLRAHHRLASLCLRLGRLVGAKKHLQIAGQNIDMGGMLLGVVEKVEKHLQNCYIARSVADWSAVVRESDAAIVAGADSAPQLFALKAEALLKLHRLEEADIVLSTAQKIEGALRKSTSMEADTTTLLVQAQVDMAVGRFEGAVIAAEKAAYLHPENPDALLTLKRARAVACSRTTGNDLYKAGKMLEASMAYSEGLQYDPNNAILLCNRAACRSKLGHYEKAVEDCNAALDAQPLYTKALLRRAHSYSKMERWEQSLKDYEALRKEMPGNLEVAQAILEVQVAMKKLSRSGTEEKHLGVEIVICSNDQLREAISNHGIAVVQFNTRWSQGCRQMASVVEQLHKLNPTVNFLKVDTEANPYLAKAENVDFVPTFKIYKNGSKVMELAGPTQPALENALSHICKYY